MIQRVRRVGMDASIDAINWIDRHILERFDYPSRWLDLGWWIEDIASAVFGFFYNGSDEEILSAIRGETPRQYMSKRQREFASAAIHAELKWCDFFDEFFCADCDRELDVVDEARLCAGCRALHPELLLEDRK